MEQIEKIEVYIRTEKGKTKCICHAANKKCGRDCDRDLVRRDRYEGWVQTFKRNRFGK